MRRRAHSRRGVALAAAVVALTAPTPLAAAATADQDKLEAEIAKLAAETNKLEGDNRLVARLPGYGAVLAAGVALSSRRSSRT